MSHRHNSLVLIGGVGFWFGFFVFVFGVFLRLISPSVFTG